MRWHLGDWISLVVNPHQSLCINAVWQSVDNTFVQWLWQSTNMQKDNKFLDACIHSQMTDKNAHTTGNTHANTVVLTIHTVQTQIWPQRLITRCSTHRFTQCGHEQTQKNTWFIKGKFSLIIYKLLCWYGCWCLFARMYIHTVRTCQRAASWCIRVCLCSSVYCMCTTAYSLYRNRWCAAESRCW